MNRVCVCVKLDNIPIFINSGLFVTTRAARHGTSKASHYLGRRGPPGASLDAKWRRAMQSPELLGPLLQVERNILGASPSMQDHILSVATRCATEPYSAAPPRRGTGPLPSSDAEASTDRAPRPAVWASTALSSGRVVVRGADVTGGKRGAAGRAGASRGRQPLPTTPPTRTSLALWAPRTAVGAARPAPHIGARRRGPTL